MSDCGTCDYCVFRATGAMPEPTRFGLLKVNTDCRMSKLSYGDIISFDPKDFMSEPLTFREIELRNSKALTGYTDRNGDPILNGSGQQVIRAGQALLARPAPDGGYRILLRAEDVVSVPVWDNLGDYLRNTVSLRFGERRMKVEIWIT